MADKMWLDGEYVDSMEASVPLWTHTLHYGLGVFEGIRAYRRADGRVHVFRLKEHVRRLFDGALICMLDMPFTQQQLADACLDLVRTNGGQPCYIRPLVFIGHGAMGLYAMNNPTRVAIMTWAWGKYLGEEGIRNGIRAKVSSFTRHHVNASMVKGKIVGQYVNSVLAKREVIRAGYEEALQLDKDGYVSEASGENIFMVRDGVLRTPHTGASILNGITRDAIVTIAKDLGIPVHEQRFTRDELYCADECFLTGTAAEVTPVREIDNRKIGLGRPGPVTKRIQDAFFEVVSGRDERYEQWRTYI